MAVLQVLPGPNARSTRPPVRLVSLVWLTTVLAAVIGHRTGRSLPANTASSCPRSFGACVPRVFFFNGEGGTR